jgi:hypothetical protein
LDHYREIQKQYLEDLKLLDADIPQDKQKLFKILIDKDYDEHPTRDEPKKNQKGL